MIVSENPVLTIFKNNGYKTHFITETGYMLFNRPRKGFDYYNIDYADIPFVNTSVPDDHAVPLAAVCLSAVPVLRWYICQDRNVCKACRFSRKA